MPSFLILSIQKKKKINTKAFLKQHGEAGKMKQDVENKRQPSPHLHFLLLKDMK